MRHNLIKPRTYGRCMSICQRCGSNKSHIGKYGLNICRRCFREIASKIGFKKNR